MIFHDTEEAECAFIGAGPMQLAIIMESGKRAVDEGVRKALSPFTEPDGRVTLPAWYRAVMTKARNAAGVIGESVTGKPRS